MIEYVCTSCKHKDRPDYLCDFCGGLGFVSHIKSGDKFFAKESNSTYTVTGVINNILNGSTTIEWDCVGKQHWYKKVTPKSIQSWIEEGRLVRC